MFKIMKMNNPADYWKTRISILGGIAIIALVLFFLALPASIENDYLGNVLLVGLLAGVAIVLEFKRLNGHLGALYFPHR